MDRGLARSRERARALVLAGVVRVEDQPAGKAGSLVSAEARITIITPDHPFVGRGGVKLREALKTFAIDASGRVALDIGASTGGFTDCLLQRGALRVYALDVGKGLLDWSLRNDARVVVLERLNARYLRPSDLPERVSLAVLDVSFISLRLILPVVPPLLEPDADLLPLVKPQFEVGRSEVGPGGIVRDPARHLSALLSVAVAAGSAGFTVVGGCAAAIRGAEGNQEYFLHLRVGPAVPAAGLSEMLGGIVHGG